MAEITTNFVQMLSKFYSKYTFYEEYNVFSGVFPKGENNIFTCQYIKPLCNKSVTGDF